MSTAIAAVLGLIFSTATGGKVELQVLVNDLAARDVVFLGEEHDNTAGHQMQLQILRALHKKRPDLVVSMEMFERDVQGVLDDYLRGRIAEEAFLEHCRPWGNYKKHYRAIVEYAKANGLDVIAANAPRRSARKVAQGGGDLTAYVARKTSAVKDQYWELFKDAMKEHPGEITEQGLTRMYEAQCMKDDTMAESIADYLQGRPHRKPLVVHLCGKFHSDYGLGTVVRLLHRRPLATVGVVTMVAAEEVEKQDLEDHADKGHFVLVVKAEPKPAAKPLADAEAKPTAKPLADAEAKPKRSGKAAGLGIMPDYGSDDPGVLVSGVSGGGAAELAGIKGGDLIVKIGKETVESLEDYMDVMGDLRAGQTVKVTVKRDGKDKAIDVKLGVSRR
ncbi:MAG: hypothetical protein CMJ90_06795 [Planctomycetes bacterium]|nr:hypothetical protein [Planctomycetota bacterium]